MAKSLRESGAGWRRWRKLVDTSLRRLVNLGALSPALAMRLADEHTRNWPLTIVSYEQELSAGHKLVGDEEAG